MTLHYIPFSNISFPPNSTQGLAHLPSDTIMVGQVLQGADCAYINVVQDQANGVYATNSHHTNTLTISGRIYYRKL